MSVIKKITIGVVVYLLFLVILFPASLAVRLAPLPSNIQLAGVEGSIWAGSVETVHLPQRQLEQVSWDVNPWALLLGKLDVDLVIGSRATAVSAKGTLGWSMSGLSASQLRFEAPNRFLIGNARLPFRTDVNGEVSLFVETLTQGTPWCEQLQGKLFLNHTHVKNQFGEYPLGDMELGLSCVDGKVQLQMDEAKNQLGVSGTLQLAAEQQVIVTAKIKETDSQPEDLKKSLMFLGKKDSQGYYPINYQGKVPGL